jgi:hypothetical protein
MTRGALRLKYSPTDVRGQIHAAGRPGRALDAIRRRFRNGLRRAGETAERSAQNRQAANVTHGLRQK